MNIKLTLKQWAYMAAAAGVLFLLLLLGFKSAKLKKTAARLLRTSGELELQKIKIKTDNLKQKARDLDEKRKQKAAAYRDYIAKLNK